MIHLDASFLIRALLAGSAEDRKARIWLTDGELFGASSIAWAEFLCGPLSRDQILLADRLVSSRLPFLDEDAEMAAKLFNETGRRRGSLADCMIAATSLRGSVPLATSNTSDFRRFTPFGLTLAG